MKPVVVSVVRDHSMYGKCVADNPYFAEFEKVSFDNNVQNLPIPLRYNSFIDGMAPDEDRWIVFCHEDWMPRQDMAKLVSGLDKSRIYGPIGVFVQKRLLRDFIIPVGCIDMCDKNGLRHVRAGRSCPRSGRVDTLDCQCMIIHSDLLRRYGLRFDERLAFDMYVEDFCAWAHARHGIKTFVVPIKCTHFSYGVTGKSFNDALEHVRKKFEKVHKTYMTVVGYKECFGRPVRSGFHHTKFPRISQRLNGLVYKVNK